MNLLNLPTLTNIIQKKSIHKIPVIPKNINVHIPQLNHIKALVFDIYGTLLHSGAGEISLAENAHNTKNSVIELPHLNMSIKTLDIQNILKTHVFLHHKKSSVTFPEVNIIKVWQDILTKEPLFKKINISNTPSTNIQTCAKYCALYYELSVNPCSVMPEAVSLLDTLTSQNIQLGIVSNAQFYTPIILQTLFNPHWSRYDFFAQVWSYKLLESKPSPHLYQHLLAQWPTLKPKEILFVGNDMCNDIHPAASLGIKTCLFAGDNLSYRPRLDMPHLNTPDAIITNLNAVIDIIKQV